MKLLGGVVFREGTPPAGPQRCRDMAAAVPGAGVVTRLDSGPASLFAAGEGAALGSREGLVVAADVDALEPATARGAAVSPRAEITDRVTLVTRLYERHGEALAEHLTGSFAFALWDPWRRRLVVGVDRFGARRLYYAETPEGLAFASRASALTGMTGGRRVDATAVYHYLNFGYVPAPHSIFAGVRRLPPGHAAVFELGALRRRRYWDLSYPEERMDAGAAATRTWELVEGSVAACLHDATTKDTGAFLSGGTDSSTVLGFMSRLTGEPVTALSIGFREARYDELGYAEIAARHFGSRHVTSIMAADEALATVPALVEGLDEPFGNNSIIPTYVCARLAREHGLDRLLAGDGGDEIFGGNEHYRQDRIHDLYRRVPAWLRRGVIEPALSALPDGRGSILGKAQRYADRASQPAARRYTAYQFFAAQDPEAYLAPELAASVDPGASWQLVGEHLDAAPATSELNRRLYLDIKTVIGDNDLLKVTRATELAGIDVRFPMLDHRLAEFTGTLPADFKVRGLEKRYLFKQAFRPLLPAEIIAKPKHGFGMPMSDWLRSHPGFRALSRDALGAAGAATRDYVRPGALARILDLHEADPTAYWGGIVWRLLMLELWHGRHAAGSRGAA